MKVLLDNSTLTAGFRASGLIRDQNRELFDLDIASLRLLIDSIILADEICIVDDYKEEYRDERKKWLNHSNISFIEIPDRIENAMNRHARAHVNNWKMMQHLGTDLSELFDDISILFKHAWRNSESFLVLKAFGVEDKYGSTITKALRNYLTDDEKDIKKIIGNNPKAYNKETLRVAQSTAWAAIRTVYYRQASVLLGAEYFSHPLRNLYNAKCILYDNHPYTRKMKLSSNDLRVLSSIGYNFQTQRYYQDINNFFKNFWQDCNKQDDNIFGVSTYDIDMPPFLAYAIERTEYHQNVIESAFKIREEAGVCELRKKLNNIYVNCDQDNMGKELRDFASELRDLKKHLQIYLGYEREKVGVTVKMISYDLTVPRFTTKPFYPHKPHLAFIRDVILELASASTMGRLLDKLYARKY